VIFRRSCRRVLEVEREVEREEEEEEEGV